VKHAIATDRQGQVFSLRVRALHRDVDRLREIAGSPSADTIRPINMDPSLAAVVRQQAKKRAYAAVQQAIMASFTEARSTPSSSQDDARGGEGIPPDEHT
jgi:hypothetical protein